MRKALPSILVAVGLVVSILAAVHGGNRAPTQALARSVAAGHKAFHNYGVGFNYPAAWRTHHFRLSSSFYRSLVFISNQRMHFPCTTRKIRGGTERDCGLVIRHLRKGGMLAEWSATASVSPTWKLSNFHGKPIRVDGVWGVWKVGFPGDCRYVGGTESLTILVPRSAPRNFFSFTACLRGPHRLEHMKQLNELVRSTRFTGL